MWRFDIWNGRPPGELVTGGVFASLGPRRFFNAPDVAYIRPRGEAPYYNLAIGSGDPASPSASGVQERFYSLRDYAPFQRLSQSDYDTRTAIVEDDLAPAGTGASPSGWKLDLPAGERALSEAITVNGTVLFTTFRPNGNVTELCEATGTNRVSRHQSGERENPPSISTAT